jgi:hypothetical protein
MIIKSGYKNRESVLTLLALFVLFLLMPSVALALKVETHLQNATDNGISSDFSDSYSFDTVPATTACTATLDADLSLHIPYLSYGIPILGTLTFWADLLYEYNPAYPTFILFKLANAGMIENASYSCTASTLSDNLSVHIPDVLLPDGITHMWLNLQIDMALSIGGNVYFLVTNSGVI